MRKLRRAALVVTALALADCTGAEKPAEIGPPPAQLAPAVLTPPAPLPPSSNTKRVKPVARAVRPPEPVKPAAPPPEVAVIGLSQDDVRKTLGEPKERIEQSPGRVWVYDNGHCTVEILFFLDVTRNGYYALDRKISGTDGSDAANRTCFSDIQNARQY